MFFLKKESFLKLLVFIHGFLWDRDRKNLSNLIADMRFLKSKGELTTSARVYVKSLMYKKDSGPLEQYISGKTYTKFIQHAQQNLGHDPILDNKLAFRSLLHKNGLSHPIYLGTIKAGVLNPGPDKKISLTNERDVRKCLSRWLNSHHQIFIKPSVSFGGRGIIKLEIGRPFNFEKLKDLKGRFIIEKGIEQHKMLNDINPYCVNTLRVTTINFDSTPRIAAAFLRMGIHHKSVDNLTSGAIFVAYNIEENALGKTAYRIPKYGGHSFLKHPETGFVFEGTKLPFWHSIKKLVLKAAQLFPHLDMVGWDVAITPTGPLLIEGNSSPTLRANQIALKGLKNSQLFKDYLNRFT